MVPGFVGAVILVKPPDSCGERICSGLTIDFRVNLGGRFPRRGSPPLPAIGDKHRELLASFVGGAAAFVMRACGLSSNTHPSNTVIPARPLYFSFVRASRLRNQRNCE